MTDDANVPGAIAVPGRRFLYLQDRDPQSFQNTFAEIAVGSEGGMPSSGGMITENTVIVVPTGEQFCGVSFKGDLEGWEELLSAYAASRALKLLRVDGAQVSLSDGTAWPLDHCKVVSYEVKRTR